MKPPSAADLATTSTASSQSQTTLNKLRVVIVDDHPITRHGLTALVNAQRNLEVCGEADSAANATEVIARLDPDLAIIDVSLPTTNGIDLTKTLKAQRPNLPILIVSMHDEALFAERALRAGAMGYVMKQEAADRISSAVQHLLRGELYLSEKMQEQIVRRARNRKQNGVVYSIDTLSEREMEVFKLLGNGFSTRQVAEQLKLSTKTIDSHREHLKMKLGLTSGTELVRHAVQWVRASGRE
jgi:DNA-binding NarL/FixJ family response regulator